ncbi:MAG: hypothetical protein WCC69_14535 [Pirellulales bacterium]
MPPAEMKKWRGDDFPSWLSPMVVKELRQGVQSGAFAWTFIGLQAAMFLLISWGLTFFEPGSRGPGQEMFGFFFWLIVSVGVLLILPLRGLGAISSERVGNNLDLVRLTRLSATRIVLGKWLAIVAQSALLVAAILPYLVLRYFFGGVNVVRDLEVIGWLFAGSMVVTAGALALSTLPLWVRIAAGALAMPPAIGFFIRFIESGGTVSFGRNERLAGLALLVLYTVVLLEYTASRIAPLAENHALRKRTIALLIGFAWLAIGARAPQPWVAVAMVALLPLVLTYAVESLLERPVHLPSQAAALARFSLPGRLAARLLTPGWATGLVFVFTLALPCAACAWMCAWRFGTERERLAVAAFVPLFLATVLFPLPAVVWLPRVRYRLLLYAFVQLLCFMVFIYTNAMKPPGLAWKDWTLGCQLMRPLPLASLASLMASNGSEEVARACLPWSGIMIATVCLAVAKPWLREMRETSCVLAAARAGRSARAASVRAGALA